MTWLRLQGLCSSMRIWAYAFVSVLVLVGAASAQDAADPERGDAELAVLQALDRWSSTYGSATTAAEMLALYAPDAVFWGTGAREPFVGADEIGPYFTRQFENFPERSVAFVDPVVHIYGAGDVATVTGLYRFEVIDRAGSALEALYRFSFALLQMDEEWQIIHQHSSQLP